MKVAVEMARGGKVLLEVEGNAYPDSDGAGHKFTVVDITSIQWPGGGKVAEKNIKNMTQVEEAYVDALDWERWRNG